MNYRNRNKSGSIRGDSVGGGGSRQVCGQGILGNAPGGLSNMNPLGMQNMMGGGSGMMGMNQGMGIMGQNNMGLMNQGNVGMGNLQQQALRESQLALVNTFLKGTIMGGSGIGMIGGSPLPSLLDIKTSGNKRRRGDSIGSSDGKRVRRESFEHNRSRERDRNNRDDRRRQQEGSLSKKRDQHSAVYKDHSPDKRQHDTSGSGETKFEEKEMYDPADPTDDEDKEKCEQPEKKSQYFCHACMVECHNEKNFGTHMKGSKHRARMDELANLHQQKSSQLVARLRAEEHLRKIEKEGGSKREFCKVCDKELNILYGRHKQTRDHQKRENATKDRQDKSDGSPDDLDDLVTIDSVGDFDESNSEKRVAKNQSPKIKKEKTIVEDDIFEMPEYDPNVPWGQNYIIPVSGFFCKLCHKFYNNESAAKFNHCQTKTHFEKFEKVIAEKLEMQKAITETEVRIELEDNKLTGLDEFDVDQHKNFVEDEGKTTFEIKMEYVDTLDKTNDDGPEEGSKFDGKGVMQKTEDIILDENSCPTSDNILQPDKEIENEENIDDDNLLAKETEPNSKEEDVEVSKQRQQEGEEERTTVARTRYVHGRGGGGWRIRK